MSRSLRWAALALAAALAGCASARQAAGPVPGPTMPPAASLPTAKPVIPVGAAVPIPDDANVIVQVDETVDSAEDDIASYTKIYVDNQPAGQTSIDAKSKTKRWGAKLPVGNHLFRFETWNLPPTGDWQMLDPQWQVPERFIRVEDGQRTIISLKFYDSGRKHTLEIGREPLPK